MRKLFPDCKECESGRHWDCPHGSHTLEHCKCITDEQYEQQKQDIKSMMED